MQANQSFRYFDPEHRQSVEVRAGADVPERVINILGTAKVEQMQRTKHLVAGGVVVTPQRKRGRPRKGG